MRGLGDCMTVPEQMLGGCTRVEEQEDCKRVAEQEGCRRVEE